MSDRDDRPLDELDRAIINRLQESFPLDPRPYREAARELGIDEAELIRRLEGLLERRMLTRFGPLYNAEQLGGGLSLCAMRVPEQAFDRVAEQVNAFPEVAHNYARDHAFNLWFVLATGTPERIGEVLAEIEQATGLPVYDMPKEEEFFVGLRFEV